MSFIVSSSFKTSATDISNAPTSDHGEVIFLGRSNVGKSSLLNSLTNKKALAKVSSTPGKTRLINFFDTIFSHCNSRHNVTFIDLPGFGYAKVSKKEKKNEIKD